MTIYKNMIARLEVIEEADNHFEDEIKQWEECIENNKDRIAGIPEDDWLYTQLTSDNERMYAKIAALKEIQGMLSKMAGIK